MSPITRNILAVIGGIVVGSMVNMAIIMLSSYIIPPPAGASVSSPEELKSAVQLFEGRHFIFPFLAHALGTLAGAFVAAKLAVGRRSLVALGVGLVFLIGGIINVIMLPSPLWYTLIDLIGAYFPMAELGGRLATQNQSPFEKRK